MTEIAFCFVLPDSRSCKELWKSAVEHHTFFRLTDRCPSPPKRRRFFRLGSRFHASFNTEYQLHNLNLFGSSSFRKRRAGSTKGTSSAPSTPNVSSPRSPEAGVKTVSSFRRMPSRRFTSRPSFANRTGLEERNKARRNWFENQKPAANPVSPRQTPDVFDKARTVVNVERASRRELPTPAHCGAAEPDGDASQSTGQPSLRQRSPPAFSPNERMVTTPQTAVRVTPKLGVTDKIVLQSPPMKPPRKALSPLVRNGAPLRDVEVNEW